MILCMTDCVKYRSRCVVVCTAKGEQDVPAERVYRAQSHDANQPPCAQCPLHPCPPDLQGHLPEKVSWPARLSVSQSVTQPVSQSVCQ